MQMNERQMDPLTRSEALPNTEVCLSTGWLHSSIAVMLRSTSVSDLQQPTSSTYPGKQHTTASNCHFTQKRTLNHLVLRCVCACTRRRLTGTHAMHTRWMFTPVPDFKSVQFSCVPNVDRLTILKVANSHLCWLWCIIGCGLGHGDDDATNNLNICANNIACNKLLGSQELKGSGNHWYVSRWLYLRNAQPI